MQNKVKSHRNYSYHYMGSEQSVSQESVPFAVVESYKTIRTNLLFVLSHKKRKKLVVSSSSAGEGKSTTAINIAIAFSQLGRKVLLVDSDLRKPTIAKKMKLKNTKGLSSVLGNFCKAEEAVQHVYKDFDVLTSGPLPPNPSELVGSEAMSALLVELEEYYEYIIMDTPPINIVSDTLTLSTKTDGIIMIIKERDTKHEAFKKALKSIEFAEVKLLGTIINSSKQDMILKGDYK